MGAERIELSAKGRDRLKVLQQVEEGHLKQIEAARRLRLSDRQARRLQSRLRAPRDFGVGHLSCNHSVQYSRGNIQVYNGVQFSESKTRFQLKPREAGHV